MKTSRPQVRDKPEVNGQALFDGPRRQRAHLLRERLLVLGRPLDLVTCPDWLWPNEDI
ncbi:hypothetical protein [Ralstonia solanacearum]|uniref:hypothetical protein n=1 Tax=Ralstonia solanacearum TaxID=305 RepID=UPI0001816350|nr:hypothetical protein [Ralstonia solanacearum]MDC6176302.1 hypothetical protein [Ralstonia solanacearum]MDC6212682.1 hypothetical protein [Ralstonia solanacearum]MDD7803229.1 hypothetical protein [Ralstonia solanacearum]